MSINTQNFKSVAPDWGADEHFIDGSSAEETNLKDSLKVFPNLRFSFMKISFINQKIKKISALALAIILIPLKVIQDIYYHSKQLVGWAFKPSDDLPNNNTLQIPSRYFQKGRIQQTFSNEQPVYHFNEPSRYGDYPASMSKEEYESSRRLPAEIPYL